jgi:DNA modification methylase
VRPYYEDDAVTIYHGDCREAMVPLSIPGVMVTDPPYGNDTAYDTYRDSQENLRGLITEVVLPWLGTNRRAMITPGVGNMWLYPPPTWTLCFASGAGTGSGPWGFTSWQPILAYGKDPYLAKGLGRRPDTKLTSEAGSRDGGAHPCPKPLALMRWIISRSVIDQSDCITDPFMGSGTTLRAAKDLGRKAIGIEIEERYCEIAANRMAQSVLALETL